jgi:hypothetical protein
VRIQGVGFKGTINFRMPQYLVWSSKPEEGHEPAPNILLLRSPAHYELYPTLVLQNQGVTFYVLGILLRI